MGLSTDKVNHCTDQTPSIALRHHFLQGRRVPESDVRSVGACVSQPVYVGVGLGTDKVNHGTHQTPSTGLPHPSSREE